MTLPENGRKLGSRSKLVDKLIDSNNTLVIQKIEDKIEQMEQKKLAILQKCEILGKPKRGYSEMFELALRRNVLKLAFKGRIPYTRENGFSNPEISIPFKVLGSNFGTENVMAHRGRGDLNLIKLYISIT